jgi:hypothetical protein
MRKKRSLEGASHPTIKFPASAHPSGPQESTTVPLVALSTYLTAQKNSYEDIRQLDNVLQLPYIILEIGCGCGMLASEIARNNPAVGVIATDLYDDTIPFQYGSGYQKTALCWKGRQLECQQGHPHNFVLLRANIDILSHLPEASINTILMVNPEPSVGRLIMETLADHTIYRKIRPGEKQVVILPFSREMGVTCCGGNEFYHDADWSRGLGFMMASGFEFRKGDPVQWHVNLSKFSHYSRYSTQQDLYILGNRSSVEISTYRPKYRISCIRTFFHKARRIFKDA